MRLPSSIEPREAISPKFPKRLRYVVDKGENQG